LTEIRSAVSLGTICHHLSGAGQFADSRHVRSDYLPLLRNRAAVSGEVAEKWSLIAKSRYLSDFDSIEQLIMTTLVDIPSCTALHIPTPTSQPLPLSSGDLTLTLIPANPPTHPSQTVTLTIGASSFPLLPNSPVQKIQSAKEHASYIFTPVPADGGAGIGRVKIVMKDR